MTRKGYGRFVAAFFLLVALFLPETKGRSLEEIERLFAKESLG